MLVKCRFNIIIVHSQLFNKNFISVRELLIFQYLLVHFPIFEGLSGSEDRGGGDNSIQFINVGRVGDKSFRQKF